MSPTSGSWSSQKITLGALGDSFYEYLIKQVPSPVTYRDLP